jgi:hypothetical protein
MSSKIGIRFTSSRTELPSLRSPARKTALEKRPSAPYLEFRQFLQNAPDTFCAIRVFGQHRQYVIPSVRTSQQSLFANVPNIDNPVTAPEVRTDQLWRHAQLCIAHIEHILLWKSTVWFITSVSPRSTSSK